MIPKPIGGQWFKNTIQKSIKKASPKNDEKTSKKWWKSMMKHQKSSKIDQKWWLFPNIKYHPKSWSQYLFIRDNDKKASPKIDRKTASKKW